MMIGWDAEADNLGNYQEFVVEKDEFEKYSLVGRQSSRVF